MFTAPNGTVHPVRDSPGYDELEEHAAAVGRRREDARESYEAGERMAAGSEGYIGLKRDIMSFGGLSTGGRWSRADIPDELYRVNGKSPDEAAEELGMKTHGSHRFEDGNELIDKLNNQRRAAVAVGRIKGARSARLRKDADPHKLKAGAARARFRFHAGQR